MTDDELLKWFGWVQTESGCWEWSGRIEATGGYGIVNVRGHVEMAHRLAYQTWVAPIPDGLVVRHRCDNRPCINPEHLVVGTHLDNVRDMFERGRANFARGEEHGFAKLSVDQVRYIRDPSSRLISDRKLAVQFGINASTVGKIRRGERWRHVL